MEIFQNIRSIVGFVYPYEEKQPNHKKFATDSPFPSRSSFVAMKIYANAYLHNPNNNHTSSEDFISLYILQSYRLLVK